MTSRQTKGDLLAKIDHLQQQLAACQQRVKDLEIEPGIFTDGWRNSGPQYAARPKCKDYETQSRLEDAARDSLASGDFDASGQVVTQLVIPYNDSFPAGIDAAVVRYSYSDADGIISEGIWPAVRLTAKG